MKFGELFKKDYVQTVIMVLITIAIVVVFWFGLRFAFRTEHPLLAVASGSMEPVLYKGDLILVQGVQNACNIHAAPKYNDPPGDVIVFRKPNYPYDLIVHRAVKQNTEDQSCSFTTQGDANPGPDHWKVGESYVVGKYTGVKVPLLGYIALFFEPFEIKVAFILLWVILLIILELIPLSKRQQPSEEEQNQTKPL